MFLSDVVLAPVVITHDISLAHLATVGEATWRRARSEVYTVYGRALPHIVKASGNQTRL